MLSKKYSKYIIINITGEGKIMTYDLLGKKLEFDARHGNMGFLNQNYWKTLDDLVPKFEKEYYALAENPDAWGEKFYNDLLMKYVDLIINSYLLIVKNNKIFAYDNDSYFEKINQRYLKEHIESAYMGLSDIEDDPANSGGFFANIRKKKLESEFLKNHDTYWGFVDCLMEVAENARDYTATVLQNETADREGKALGFMRVSKDDEKKAQKILDNVQNLSRNDKIEGYIQAIGYNYLNEEIYSSIIRDFPSERENVEKIKKALYMV